MKRLLAVTFVASSTMLAAAALAARPDDGPGSGPHPRGGFDVARMQSELGLSDDQVAQLQKMKSDGRTQAIRRHADLRVAEGELQDLIQAPAVDEKAISAKVKQVTDLQAASTRARVDQRLALRRVLTPEQLAKMESLVREHRGDRRPSQHRGSRGPRPGDQAGEPGPGTDQ
jgi:Spy/CpxP family protein refolding chaperone